MKTDENQDCIVILDAGSQFAKVMFDYDFYNL